MSHLFFILAACCAVFFTVNQAEGCTAFQLKSVDGSLIYCRSLEYSIALESNFLVVPRGEDFTGSAPNGKPGLRWKTKYGHAGMNQSMAKTLLTDGMNEAGLIVGALYLPGYTQYQSIQESSDPKTIGSWEVVSYLLSTCSNVDEVKQALSTIFVVQQPFPLFGFVLPLHYYVTDRQGFSLVIEYVNGKKTEYENPLGVLTNAPTFDWQLINLGNFANLSFLNVSKPNLNKFNMPNFGQGPGLLGIPGDYTSPSRFVRAALYSQWAVQGRNNEETVKQ